MSIKKRLKNGEKANGCWIEMFNPISTEIIAASGYDTVFIDLEHGPGSLLDAVSAMQAMGKYQSTPLIRTSSSDIVDIKRVLDIGPAGIMIPNVRTVQEAESVVEYCRYGPRGLRGAAPAIIRATDFGDNMDDYSRFMEEDFLLIAQIECEEAVDQIEEIAKVDGIDMLFIGPSDLSASLGSLGEYDSPKFNSAFEKVERVTIDSGKLLGTIPIPGREAQRLYENGHSLVVSGADALLLQSAAKADVALMKAAVK